MWCNTHGYSCTALSNGTDILPVISPVTDITKRKLSKTTYAAATFMFHVKAKGAEWEGGAGCDLLWKLMAGVIFQKVTLHLAQRLFSTDLYLFKGNGGGGVLWLSAITNALTNSRAVCHLEFI